MKGLKNMFAGMNSPNAIKKLIDKSLLETDHNGNYWLHPLVQEFSYSDLENKEEVHKFAMEYYLSLPIPEKLAKKKTFNLLLKLIIMPACQKNMTRLSILYLIIICIYTLIFGAITQYLLTFTQNCYQNIILGKKFS